MIETLIYHKKKMYYLLSHMPEQDMIESERSLLTVLENDIELNTELMLNKVKDK